jgi:polyhydroxybutyrate depolymerase
MRLFAVAALGMMTLGACTTDEAGLTTTGSGGSASVGGGGDDASGGSGGTGTGATTSTGAGGTGGAGAGPNTSPGCVDGQGLAEGEHTFMLDGLERRYVLRLPVNYDPTEPWPLVLALHGNGGSIAYWDVTSGPRNIRAVLEEEAVLIIVEAIGGNWRDYDADPSTWPAGIEKELAYFEEVLTQAKTDLCIDQDAIFSMGFSGGGSFSGVLGCRRSDIRAIAVGGSVIYFEEEDCIHTPAAWITIGTQELTAGREAFRDFFRDRAMCQETTMPTAPSPCEAYDGCDAATPVHYCQHPDGHIWPDFGSQAMWDFFSSLIE